MGAGGTEPIQQTPDWAYAQAPSKRRAWPWLVAFGIVAVLAIGAWFLGEWVAKDLVTKTIQDQVTSRLALPDDHEVDVEVTGVVIPQLIRGRLDEVSIASEDVPIGPATADVSLVATGVPIRGGGSMGGATAVVHLDQEQLRALMATVDGFPADTLGLEQPDVTMSTALSLFGISFPIGVGLAPSAVEGDLVLSPSALQLGSADISADDLRDRFGGLADVVLRDWTLCVAQYLPAAVTLTGVAVEGSELEASFDISGGVLNDPAQQAMGTCE
ncbi:MAG: DUF2993 domain-containing protein [Microbacterium sp.]